MHGHAFGDWVLFDLQLLQLAFSESKLTFARVAAEAQLINTAVLKQPLTSVHPNQWLVAIEAIG
jgi:hypothetical protein